MKEPLDKYRERFQQVKRDPNFWFGTAQEFVSELLSLPPEKRFELLPLLVDIEQEAWGKGFVIPNLNIESIRKEKERWESTVPSRPGKGAPKLETVDDLNDVLFRFFSANSRFLEAIKGYFIFRLEGTEKTKTKVVVLYDDDFQRHPHLDLICTENRHYEIRKSPIRDFVLSLEKDPDERNQSYLCVILVTPNLNSNQIIIDEIYRLTGLVEHCNFISVSNASSLSYEILNKDAGMESINSYCNKVLNNRAFSFEEEAIIKKLFEGKELVLDYKFLKSGNSGSKVVEIHPSRMNNPQTGRFIVKFSAKGPELKIKKEHRRFKECISDLQIRNYYDEYDSTISHEAIRYWYASSDGKKESHPFSELINACVQGKYDYPYTLQQVIDELFGCEPYRVWAETIANKNEQVKSFYGEYINSEKRVLDSICAIKAIDSSLIVNQDLVKSYNLLKDYSLQTKEKICHGDLHSENFFKDEEGVYLIDFGWTGRRHAVIDHATLECSLKFKHIPYYIPIEELLSYEQALLSPESFSTGFDLSFVKRKEVKDILSLIVQIRVKSKEFVSDNSSPLEYLISLFVMTFRQIQYADLNQQYAMRSAEIIGQAITEIINGARHDE